MLSKSLFFQIVLRVLLISGFALANAYLFFKGQYILAFVFLLAILVQAVLLIRFLNSSNRKVSFFFESLKNDDFSLHFSEKEGSSPYLELHQNMNALNKRVQGIYHRNKIQELYYEEILSQAEIGMLTFNKEGHILYVNPRVEQLFNYRPLNHIKQLKRVDPDLYDLFSKLEPFDRELIQLKNEREKIELVLKSKSVILNKEPLLLVVVQDIHKELNEKETDSWLKLIRVLTHEIMNSVSPITSISESILNHLHKNDSVIPLEEFSEAKLNASIKGLEVIKDQGASLMEFVQSYRTFLNVAPPNKTILEASKLFHKIELLFQEFSNSSELEIIVEPPDLNFFCDEQQITQVLINLCKNAVQAIDEQELKHIKLIGRMDGDKNKIIEVWDNGPGIPEHLQEEIFIPFFTTKEEGTGVGLSLSRQIIRQHGGSLNFTSSPTKGSSFIISF